MEKIPDEIKHEIGKLVTDLNYLEGSKFPAPAKMEVGFFV